MFFANNIIFIVTFALLLTKMRQICVLLSTYNGERFLKTQIDSILSQQDVDVQLLVRDDGSKDSTLQILEEYQCAGKLTYYTGKNLGPARSFMDLMEHAPESHYYALADQDDYWPNDKLSIALTSLDDHRDFPSLYFCPTEPTDENLKPMGIIQGTDAIVSFGESLVYEYASGCTMVFNDHLRQILMQYTPQYLPMHDHWILCVAQAIDGHIVFDRTPHILYRQHGNNVVGAHQSKLKVWKERFNRIFVDKTCERSRTAQEIYQGYHDIIPQKNMKILSLFLQGKDSLGKRIKIIINKNIKSGNSRCNMLFHLAVLLNRY